MLGHRQRYAGYRAYVEAGIDEDIKRYYSCQQIGDIPLKDIAKTFALNHVGSVSRMIHDIKVKLTQGEYASQMRNIEKQL